MSVDCLLRVALVLVMVLSLRKAARTIRGIIRHIEPRSDLKAARSSSAKSAGSSHAAKWPPLLTSFQ